MRTPSEEERPVLDEIVQTLLGHSDNELLLVECASSQGAEAVKGKRTKDNEE